MELKNNGRKYVIGIDLGVASVGSAVISEVPAFEIKNGVRYEIEAMFSRVWEKKDSAAQDWQNFRATRRTYRARRSRMRATREIMREHGLDDATLLKDESPVDPWEARVKGLDHLLSPREWYAALLYIARHRGFPGKNLQIDSVNDQEEPESAEAEADTLTIEGQEEEGTAEKKEEKRKMTACAAANEALLALVNEEGRPKYRTIGEAKFHQIILEDGVEKVVAFRRNRGEKFYGNTIWRQTLEHEVATLFACQREQGSLYATEAFEAAYLQALNIRKAPVSAEQVWQMYRHCKLEPAEKVAPAKTMSFERYRLFSSIAKLSTFKVNGDGKKTLLNASQQLRIIEEAYKLSKAELSYADLRNILQLPDDERFTIKSIVVDSQKKGRNKKDPKRPKGPLRDANAGTIEEAREYEKKKTFIKLPGLFLLKDIFLRAEALYCEKHDKAPTWRWSLDQYGRACAEFVELADTLAEELSYHLDEEALLKTLHEAQVPVELCEASRGTQSKFFGAGSVSFLALRKLLPLMQPHICNEAEALRPITPHHAAVKRYGAGNADEAVYAEGHHCAGRKRVKRGLTIPYHAVLDADIRNPVVRKAVWQACRVINAIIREKGAMPSAIHIESCRDIKTLENAKAHAMNQRINEARRKAAIAGIESFKNKHDDLKELKIDEEMILRYQLFNDQSSQCIFTGFSIDLRDVILNRNIEVDHALPKSLTFDDSFNNKILVLTGKNRTKGQMTPFEYLAGPDSAPWRAFAQRVRDTPWSNKKKAWLLTESLEGIKEKFINRNLTDSAYAAKRLREIVRDYLSWKGHEHANASCRTISYQMVAKLRKQWGIEKDRTDDRHHANDALIAACIDPRMQQDMVTYFKMIENGVRRPPFPDAPFNRKAHAECYDRIFISRESCRLGWGAAHDETLYGKVKKGRTPNEDKGDQNSSDEQWLKTQRVRLQYLKIDSAGSIYDISRAFRGDPRNARVINEIERRLKEGEKRRDSAKGKLKDKPAGWFAFADPNRPDKSPVMSGKGKNKGHEVKAITLCSEIGETDILIRDETAIGEKGGYLRTDVYLKKGGKEKGYYIVGVPYSSIGEENTPTRYFTQGKVSSKDVDESFEFQFSLYSGDYVILETPKGEEKEGYFRNADCKNGIIRTDFAGERRFKASGKDDGRQREVYQCSGVRGLKALSKMSVDILGRKKVSRTDEMTSQGRPLSTGTIFKNRYGRASISS